MKIIIRICLFSILILFSQCSSNYHTKNFTLKWHKSDGYKWADLKPNKNGSTGFKRLDSDETGISFVNNLSKKDYTKNTLFLNGSGVAAGDIDGDGLVDVYFTQLDGPNKLYQNLGKFHFRDITDSAGVALPDYKCTGAVFSDVNGDGKLDLLVSTYRHGTVLFLNKGKDHFIRDRKAGLDSTTVGGTTLTLADINGDGYLDLYVAHYRERTINDMYTPKERSPEKITNYQNGKYTIKKSFQGHYAIVTKYRNGKPNIREFGTTDELYLNKGGTGKNWKGFKKVKDLKAHFLNAKGEKTGLAKDWGLTARFEDINHDGLPDLYVCNDFWTPDRVWINQGNGVFKAMNPLNIRHYCFSSMSIAIGDINNDGNADMFVTDMQGATHQHRLREGENITPFLSHVGDISTQPQYSRNMLYINRGDNTFTETAYYSGVAASGWSWTTNFMDVNLNGREDLLVNTGNVYDVRDMDTQLYLNQQLKKHPYNMKKYRQGLLSYPPLQEVNKVYRNNGNLTFTDVSKKWGFHAKDVSQGLALADLNNDGTLDLITNRLNKPAGIYKNRTGAPRISVRLIGNAPNTQAIGARVVLHGGPLLQEKQVVSGGNYLSGSDPQLMFAAGKGKRNRSLIIYWPDGKTSTIHNIRANRMYAINEATIPTQKGRVKPRSFSKPIFKDVSKRLNFKEHEDTYNDFQRQPLLPLKLSQEDPGMAWIDYNEDGRPDLFETSGKGGAMALFKNEGHGRFRKVNLSGINKATNGDQTAVIGWRTANGTNLIVGRSDYEMSQPGGPSAYHYLIRHGRVVKKEPLPDSPSSTGPLAAADYNRDGSIDLFVGGRVIPGQYPKAASSALYKNINGHFVLDQTNSKLLNKIGMVTGAVFTDYNQDGWPDLLLSTSWGSLKLFQNDHGTFHNVTKQVGLNKYHGWWHGVATGDFNNDGYPDIVATNWGQNSQYHVVSGHPMRMYYNDMNSDGVLDIIQSNYDTKMKAYVPIKPLYDYYSLPLMASRIKSYHQYSSSPLKKIVGPALEIIPYKQINILQSMVFINKGGKHFVAHPLPRAAQLTANFDAGIADYNNDGNEDIFLSQNFFDLPRGESRLDGGRGLWLEGNGKGDFKAVPGQKSGIKVYGEQRGAALGDFNNDGRVDLAISQNAGQTKLYQNQTPKSGLRIRLVGPPQNRDAIGSSIRLRYKNGGEGPEREIQAGSGYLSQNSSNQVMGYKGNKMPESIELTWFNGKKEQVKLKGNKRYYVIRYKNK